ncbi:MAG: lysylphosphatidylglycerol synthase transmembrane domain-containing protein [Patescibacteria group bacterium]|nr:lysylphosphatidylglycerol synthase transmembrane domain-containing protein [Patescibacteria group bacterium]
MNKIKKVFFLLFSLLIGLSLFILAIQQAGINSVAETILFFPLSVILTVFLINFFAVCIVGSFRWKIIIDSQSRHKINFIKVIRAKLAGFAVSYITPSILIGGEPVRAYMIKEEAGCDWEKSFASVIIDQAIYLFTMFLFMVVGFLFLVDHFSLPVSVFYGFGIIISATFLIFYLFYSRLINKNSDGHGFFMFIIKTIRLDRIKFIKRKEENIERTEKIIAYFFRKENKAFIKAFVFAIVEVLLYLVTIWIIILYLGKTIDLAYAIAIFFILTLANLVPIPGSLGSFEASLTFIFNLLELEKSNGFTFSLIFRFINIMLVFVGFFSLVYFELRTVSHHFSKRAPKSLLKMHRFLVKVFCKKKNNE